MTLAYFSWCCLVLAIGIALIIHSDWRANKHEKEFGRCMDYGLLGWCLFEWICGLFIIIVAVCFLVVPIFTSVDP